MPVKCWVHDDNRESVSIGPGDKYPIKMFCHRGCAFVDLRAEARIRGWWPAEADPPPPPSTIKVNAKGDQIEIVNYMDWRLGLIFYTRTNGKPEGEAVHCYHYEDPNGVVQHVNFRFLPKTFKQGGFHPQTGKFQARMDGIFPLLYNLPRVIEAAKAGKTVFFCEGEKDADNMKRYGFCATTMPMGASTGRTKWKKEYGQWLTGARVVVFADNDLPDKQGRKTGLIHAHGIALELSKLGIQCTVISMPAVEYQGRSVPVKDVSDWIEGYEKNGHKAQIREKIWELVKSTPDWTQALIPEDQARFIVPQRPQAVTGDPENPDSYIYIDSDMSNTKRFLLRYGDHVVFTKAAGPRFWNGKRWELDECDQIFAWCQETLLRVRKEVDDAPLEHRVIMEKHAKKCQDEGKQRALYRSIKSKLARKEDLFDSEDTSHLLNCRNGTIDLRTGELLPHDPKHYITRCIDIDYKPGAPCPKWLNHFELVFKGDQDLIAYVKRALGYSAFGCVWEHAVFILEGEGSNGKGTLINTVYRVLGPYACNTETETLMVGRENQNIRNDLARLKGARLVMAPETREGQTLDDGLIKAMSGDDPITARFLNKEYFEYWPQFKIWITANKKPRTNDNSKGMRRRLHFIPFHAEIPEELWNDRIREELWEEREGILAFLVEGAVEWYRNGAVGTKSRLKPPKAVLQEGKDYWLENDVIERFLAYRCEMHKGVQEVFHAKTEIYKAYQEFVKENDPQHRILSELNFSQRLKRKGYPEGREGEARIHVYYGLRLKVLF